jgi:hypothetical protein
MDPRRDVEPPLETGGRMSAIFDPVIVAFCCNF